MKKFLEEFECSEIEKMEEEAHFSEEKETKTELRCYLTVRERENICIIMTFLRHRIINYD